MTVVAVPATLPHPDLVVSDLPDTSPLSADESAELYAAMFKDVVRAADASGGELLVNYRAADDLPDRYDSDPEAELRALTAEAVNDIADVRFEVQVGSNRAARVGNTITHLLDEEGVRSAAVADPRAPLLGRSQIDSAAMKLRTNELVLGPAAGGRIYFAGCTEPIDFEDAYRPPALETFSVRGHDAGHDIEFVESLPVVEDGDDLLTLCSRIRSRVTAGRIVPQYTTELLDDLGLFVTDEDGEAVLGRE
ncbi:hypothetical protein [Natranaeroarchaeum sulfidigenes]|uniref:DUF2064 domain-containing protein n=1 Tax=Natranaeroarchaeum sulfidigenes TaxID=2784880 RepID=A0A897MWH2_9EURY|nr:hypothetical protein [Natranaeroarchaeum sulfidigenes]QSG02655.1 Uncharacterized protein AArcS_1442 [Natranaeroarchaeum sulfidigenes]